MKIEDYLLSTRGEYRLITATDGKLGDVSSLISEMVKDFVSADCIFISSGLAKYELVTSNETRVCVCDRQADLFSSALDTGARKSQEGDFEAVLEAAIFVAANLLFFQGRPKLANQLLDDYVLLNYHNYSNLQSHFSRQYFEVFHECGHMRLMDDPLGAESDFRLIAQQAFWQVLPDAIEDLELSKRFESEDELECASDTFAMYAGAKFLLENGDLMAVCLGGLPGYLKASVETCVFQWCLKTLRNTIDSALLGSPLPPPPTYQNMWRQRVCRKVANQVLIDYGMSDKLSEFSDDSRKFFEAIYPPFCSKVPTFIHSAILSRVDDVQSTSDKYETERFLSRIDW